MESSAAAKPPVKPAPIAAGAADPHSDAAQAAKVAKENQIVLDDNVLDNLSVVDLKRSYILLGREYKSKVNTVMAL